MICHFRGWGFVRLRHDLAVVLYATLLAVCFRNAPASAAEAGTPLVSLQVRETYGIERNGVAVSSGLPFARGTLEQVDWLAVINRRGATN